MEKVPHCKILVYKFQNQNHVFQYKNIEKSKCTAKYYYIQKTKWLSHLITLWLFCTCKSFFSSRDCIPFSKVLCLKRNCFETLGVIKRLKHPEDTVLKPS